MTHVLPVTLSRTAFPIRQYGLMFTALVMAFVFAVIGTVGAQTVAPTTARPVAPNQGITISPFLSETKILPNEQTKDVSIDVSNNTGFRQSFVITALDFGSLGDSGGVVFAGDNASKLTRKYGLANWLQLPVDHLVLDPGQSTKVLASILNQPSLGPGGHYAAIIISVDTKTDAGSKATISVQQKISALLFTTKVGGEVYDLQLKKISTASNWHVLPDSVTLAFKNTGNVHVIPRGVIKLIAPNGQTASQGIINQASSYVLPETTRQLIVPIEPVSNSGWQSGTYKLQVDYRYDGFGRFASRTISFKYINIFGISLIVGAALCIVYAAYKIWPKRQAIFGFIRRLKK